MGYYKNQSCPNCKYSFTNGFQRIGFEHELGLPKLKCPNCSTILVTKNELWSKMNVAQKMKFIWSRILQSIANGIALGFLLMIAAYIFYFRDLDVIKSFNQISPYLTIGILISGFHQISQSVKMIKEVEKAVKFNDPEYYADV